MAPCFCGLSLVVYFGFSGSTWLCLFSIAYYRDFFTDSGLRKFLSKYTLAVGSLCDFLTLAVLSAALDSLYSVNFFLQRGRSFVGGVFWLVGWSFGFTCTLERGTLPFPIIFPLVVEISGPYTVDYLVGTLFSGAC